MHLAITVIAAPSRTRLVCLKIGLKSEAILIVSGFFGEELFFAEKWGVVGESGLAPRCTGKPMNRADNFNEPAPAVAIRPDHYVFHTIAEVAT